MFGSRKQAEGCGQWISTKSKRNFRQPQATKHSKKKSFLKKDHLPNVFVSSSPIPERVKQMLKRAKQSKMDRFFQSAPADDVSEMGADNNEEETTAVQPKFAGVCKRRHQALTDLNPEEMWQSNLQGDDDDKHDDDHDHWQSNLQGGILKGDYLHRHDNNDDDNNDHKHDDNDVTFDDKDDDYWQCNIQGGILKDNNDHNHDDNDVTFDDKDDDEHWQSNLQGSILKGENDHKHHDNDVTNNDDDDWINEKHDISGIAPLQKTIDSSYTKQNDEFLSTSTQDGLKHVSSSVLENGPKYPRKRTHNEHAFPSAKRLKPSIREHHDSNSESDEQDDSSFEVASSPCSFQYTQWVRDQVKKCKRIQHGLLPVDASTKNKITVTSIHGRTDVAHNLRDSSLKYWEINTGDSTGIDQQVKSKLKDDESRKIDNLDTLDSEAIFQYSQWVQEQKEKCRKLQHASCLPDSIYSDYSPDYCGGDLEADQDETQEIQSTESSFRFTQWVSEQKMKCKQLQRSPNSCPGNSLSALNNTTEVKENTPGSIEEFDRYNGQNINYQGGVYTEGTCTDILSDVSNRAHQPARRTKMINSQFSENDQENKSWQDSNSFRYKQWVEKQKHICKRLHDRELEIQSSEED